MNDPAKPHLLSENPWNRKSRLIEVCGEFERALYGHDGERVAIAVGRTAEQCIANSELILAAFDDPRQVSPTR